MIRLFPLCGLAAVLAVVLASAGGATGIYRWTDADGRIHFTQDLNQVPAVHRDEAERRAGEAPSVRVNTYSSGAASGPAARLRRGRPLQIPFERRGNAMLVYVRINDRVTAPFLVDTGASDVAIPAAVARKAGVSWGADSPHASYQTANGVVRKPIVELDSIQVGDARVEGLRGSVSTSMSVGLLGGTFFNNFTFQVDPASQVITLVANDAMRSGMNAEAWRERFAELRGKIAAVEAYLTRNLTSETRVAELEGKRDALHTELEQLEREANSAGVPQAWRY